MLKNPLFQEEYTSQKSVYSSWTSRPYTIQPNKRHYNIDCTVCRKGLSRVNQSKSSQPMEANCCQCIITYRVRESLCVALLQTLLYPECSCMDVPSYLLGIETNTQCARRSVKTRRPRITAAVEVRAGASERCSAGN